MYIKRYYNEYKFFVDVIKKCCRDHNSHLKVRLFSENNYVAFYIKQNVAYTVKGGNDIM